MDNILEVSGINKSYDDFSLKDISFYLVGRLFFKKKKTSCLTAIEL